MNKWLCTCKSVHHGQQHATEIDSEERCIHCKYYAIKASKARKNAKKKDQPMEADDYYETSSLLDGTFELDPEETEDSDQTDELSEYEDEFKIWENP